MDIDNKDDINRNDNNLLIQSHQDSLIGHNISPKNLKILRFMGVTLLGLGILDGYYRNDFANQLLGLFILLNFCEVFETYDERFKFLKKFNFYFCLLILFYDIFWIISRFGEDDEVIYAGGYSSFYGIATKIIVGLSIITKAFCSVILFKTKN